MFHASQDHVTNKSSLPNEFMDFNANMQQAKQATQRLNTLKRELAQSELDLQEVQKRKQEVLRKLGLAAQLTSNNSFPCTQ